VHLFLDESGTPPAPARFSAARRACSSSSARSRWWSYPGSIPPNVAVV